MVGSNTENDIFSLCLGGGPQLGDGDGSPTRKIYFRADMAARKTAWVDGLKSTLSAFPALWAQMSSSQTEMYQHDAGLLSIEREAHSGDVDGDDDDALSKRIVSKKGHLK